MNIRQRLYDAGLSCEVRAILIKFLLERDSWKERLCELYERTAIVIMLFALLHAILNYC